jgi:hypothetical protein
MKLYHGTSAAHVSAILAEGLDPPSYWGDADASKNYIDGAVFAVDEGAFESEHAFDRIDGGKRS